MRPRRVEVHSKGAPLRLANIDDELTAPGVLPLPVPVRALFERDAAHETTLRNLLRREGYEDPEAVRREAAQQGREVGREEGALEAQREALWRVLALRGFVATAAQRARVEACGDRAQLTQWLERAVGATAVDEVFGEGSARWTRGPWRSAISVATCAGRRRAV